MSIKARRIIARICIAASFGLLLAEVILPTFRHSTWHGGLGVCVCAAVSIVGGLVYLRSTRGGPR